MFDNNVEIHPKDLPDKFANFLDIKIKSTWA
jgi:hypothetical protein